jgi:hypothetical protein
MNVRNKLEYLSLAKPFQPSLMFVGKAKGPSPERSFTRVDTGLTHKQ